MLDNTDKSAFSINNSRLQVNYIRKLNLRVPPDVVLGFLNSVESSLREGAGENPVEGAKLGGAGLEGFSI